MKRLKYSEFVPLGEDLSSGEQIHVNHEDCPAGTDIKRRLYIKRGEHNGTDCILAYCHHCGSSGFYTATKKSGEYINSSIKQTNRRTTQNGRVGNNSYGGRKTTDWNQWSTGAKSWIRKGKISISECSKWGIEYCPDEDKVYLPVYRDSRLIGYQLRALDGSQPKYITEAIEKPLFWYSGYQSEALVIVEDILSGIRCSEHISALALLGSGMSDEVFEFISRSGHTNFIVFLDDDNRQVKTSASKIAQRLSILGTVKVIYSNGKDPKEHSSDELKDILK